MTTTASNVRNSVNTMIVNQVAENKKQNNTNSSSNSAPTGQNTAPANKSENLSIFSAAVATYRQQNAPKDKPFTPTEEQHKTFEEAQRIIAEKRGIEPKELSPMDVMKQAAFDYHKETNDNQRANNDLQEELKSSYENHQENPEPTPTNVSSAISNIVFYTDNDFLDLSEDDQQKYLESISDYGAERDRLEKLLESQKQSNNNDDEKSSLQLGKTDKDPGDPGSSEEDYKSKKGDIIDWMMDEVIMASIDWVGNRCVDFATPLLYGSADILWQGAKLGGSKLWKYTGGKLWDATEPARERVKQSISNCIQNIKNRARNIRSNQNANPNNETSQNGNSNNEGSQRTQNNETSQNRNPQFSAAPNMSFEEIDKLILKYEEKKSNIPADNVINMYADFAEGSIFLRKDHFIKDGKKLSYESMGMSPEYVTALEKTQELRLASWICSVYTDVCGKDSTEKNDKLFNDIADWVGNTYQAAEEASLKGMTPKPIKVPDSLKELGVTSEKLNKSLERAQKELSAYTKAKPAIKQIEYNSEIFALYYTKYKMAEKQRNPQSNTPIDLEKIQAEGKSLMLQNYAALRKGDPKAISDEEMLKLSQQMSERSVELLNKKDTKTVSPDLIKTRLEPQAKETSPKTLQEFTFGDVVDIERNNLSVIDKQEEKLLNQQSSVDDQRKQIQEIKERNGSKTNTNTDQKNKHYQDDNDTKRARIQKYREQINKLGKDVNLYSLRDSLVEKTEQKINNTKNINIRNKNQKEKSL
ncbi:MAG: hypothetical protein IKC10_06925 [Alphaproteobacteria bacterium]|nr:hypothetical protein [Alphaproteobacteria bacterium]